jgi:hypothetical protein
VKSLARRATRWIVIRAILLREDTRSGLRLVESAPHGILTQIGSRREIAQRGHAHRDRLARFASRA